MWPFSNLNKLKQGPFYFQVQRLFCNFCKTSHKTKESLKKCLEKHENDIEADLSEELKRTSKWKTCFFCDKQLPSDEMLRHIQESHPKMLKKISSTALQGKETPPVFGALKPSLYKNKPFLQVLAEEEAGQRSVDKKHDDAAIEWKCGTCSVKYKNHSTLQIHIQRYHGLRKFRYDHHSKFESFIVRITNPINKETRYCCDFCGAEYLNVEACRQCLNLHLKKLIDEVPLKTEYICLICYKRFTRDYGLRNHIRQAHSMNPFRCEKCGKICNSQNHLSVHFGRCKPENLLKPQRNPQVISSSDYICHFCGRSFPSTSRHALIMHLLRRHINDPQKCSRCQKVLKNPVAFEQHTKRVCIDNKTFELCTVCGKSVLKLENHMKIHSAERCHVCDLCGAAYKQPAGLYSHKLVCNSNCSPQKRTCPTCGVVCSSYATLYIHKRYNHSDPETLKKLKEKRKFQCSSCGKKCVSQFELNEHLTIHLDERNEVCRLCNATYKSKRALYLHLTKKHEVNLKYEPIVWKP